MCGEGEAYSAGWGRGKEEEGAGKIREKGIHRPDAIQLINAKILVTLF